MCSAQGTVKEHKDKKLGNVQIKKNRKDVVLCRGREGPTKLMKGLNIGGHVHGQLRTDK